MLGWETRKRVPVSPFMLIPAKYMPQHQCYDKSLILLEKTNE